MSHHRNLTVLTTAASLTAEEAGELLRRWTQRAFVASKDHPLIGSIVCSIPPDFLFPLEGDRKRIDRDKLESLEGGASVVLQAHRQGHMSSYLTLVLNTEFARNAGTHALRLARAFNILVSGGSVPSFSGEELLAELLDVAAGEG